MQGTEKINRNQESRIPQEIAKPKILTIGFIISVILTVISVTILTWLMFSLIDPLARPVMYYTTRIVEENFFLRIVNTSEISPGQWINPKVEYKVGFYILFPIIMISSAISGLTFLVKDYKRTRLLIFINWVLYLIPIVSSIFLTNDSTQNQYTVFPGVYFDIYPVGILRWFIILNIFIQISLILFQEDFQQWILSTKGPERIETANNFRFITFLMFYAVAWLSPIVFMIDFDYHFEFLMILGLGLAMLTIWWVVGDSIRLIILMNKREAEFKKKTMIIFGVLSFVLGVIVLIVDIVIFASVSFISNLFYFSCILFIIGAAISSLMSKSLIGKIGYAINALCLLSFALFFIVIAGIMGYSELF